MTASTIDQTENSPAEPTLPYASPLTPIQPPRLGAAVATLFGAFGIAIIGGCFLIGVLVLTTESQNISLGGAAIVLMVLLYALAFACFAAAVFVFKLGFRELLRIMHS